VAFVRVPIYTTKRQRGPRAGSRLKKKTKDNKMVKKVCSKPFFRKESLKGKKTKW